MESGICYVNAAYAPYAILLQATTLIRSKDVSLIGHITTSTIGAIQKTFLMMYEDGKFKYDFY